MTGHIVGAGAGGWVSASHDRREPLLDLGDPVGVSERERPAVNNRLKCDPGCLARSDRIGIVGAAHAGGYLSRHQKGHAHRGADGGEFVVERLAQPQQCVFGRDIGADARPSGN